MRRLILEEPFSATAVWSRRLGAFALAVAAISVAMARVQVIDVTPVLAVFGAAVIFACLALLLAGAGSVVIWRTGRRGVGAIIGGVALAVLVLAEPGYLTARAVMLPLINDVSTDINDPPEFSRSPKANAARGAIGHPSIPQEWRDEQRKAYPDIQPVVLDLDSDEAWPLVLKAAANLKWRVIDEIKPGGRIGIGHLDAVDRPLIMGFPEDVTVRVRPLAGQTRIDVRSASRYGRHDFGDNARRIRRFATELQAQLDER